MAEPIGRRVCARVGVEAAKAAGMMPEHSPACRPRHAEDVGRRPASDGADLAQRHESGIRVWVCFASTREMVGSRWGEGRRRRDGGRMGRAGREAPRLRYWSTRQKYGVRIYHVYASRGLDARGAKVARTQTKA
jgi:hypothetical protein